MKLIRPVLAVFIVLAIITGILYPLAATGLAQAIFPFQASGSLIQKNKEVVGSSLIAQAFTRPEYFHARPSVAGKDGYDASGSSGSNLAPSSKALVESISAHVATVKAENPTQSEPVPADLVTASGSGLDPHISPEAALYQIDRVMSARHIARPDIIALVREFSEPRQFGILGEPVVNVLKINLALDERWPLH